MDNILNLVYDDWPEGVEFPNPNRPRSIEIKLNKFDNSPWRVSYEALSSSFTNLKIKNYKIDDVIKFSDKLFFYHIWHRFPLIYNFLDKNILPVDDSIIDLIKNTKNLHLIFMNEFEVESKLSLKKLNDLIILNGIPPSKVWLINNSQKLKDWKKEMNIEINVHSSRVMPNLVKNDEVANFITDKDSGSFFMCHNRTPRIHRYALLSVLKKYNILDDTNWSLINGWQFENLNNKDKYFSVFSKNDIFELKNEIQYFENINTFKSKYEVNYTNFNVKTNQEIFNNILTYQNSYVNITTETNFDDSTIHISEKSLKPFFYFQFPLIFASYQHNKCLKDTYGFDLFDDVIDYTYDTIENNRDRLFAFVNEVKRIHSKKEFFIEFYKNNKDRFIKNHNIVKNHNNQYDYNFFKNLSNYEENKLNLVYDSWDDINNTPYQPNSKDLYENIFHMPYDSIFYVFQIENKYIDRFKLSDVPKYPNKKFYYFVTLMPLVIAENIRQNKLPVLEEVIDCFKRNKNFNIIFINWEECEDFETFKTLHEWTILNDLNQNQIWMINNNIKLNDYKNQLNSNINVYSTKYLPNLGPALMKHSFGSIQFKPNKEGNLFMCHNRRVRSHRYGILCLLKKYNILDDTDWSLVNGWNIKNKSISSFYSKIFNTDDINDLINEINYFNSIDQKKSKYEESYDWFDRKDEYVNWSEPYKKETFENTYFNITTETEFESDLIHLTEKSFKPFYGMQFPLILASHNHIKEIKDRYDFDFFDDVIDHSYDSIQNNRNRLFTFANEIKRIYNNKEFFIEFYKNNKDRFIKNHKKSIDYAESTLNNDINFIRSLGNIPPIIKLKKMI